MIRVIFLKKRMRIKVFFLKKLN